MIAASTQFIPTNTSVSLGDCLIVVGAGFVAAIIVGAIVHWRSYEPDKPVNSTVSGFLIVLMSLCFLPVLTAEKDATNERNLESNVVSAYQVDSADLSPAGQNSDLQWRGTVMSEGYEREVLVLEDPVTFEPELISIDKKIEIPKR
mgnify:CR=1 FL=1